MRKLLCAITLFLFLSMSLSAATVVLNAVVATGASATYVTGGKRITSAKIHVWSAAGSVATVKIQQRADATAPWYTVATITNPDNATGGEYWSIPIAGQTQVNVTAYTSGTITATLEAYDANGNRIY